MHRFDDINVRQDLDMPLESHLKELRTCLLKSVAVLFLCSMVSFAFIDDIVRSLTTEAGNLYYMRPAEAFIIYMKITLLSGFFMASPFILQQLYSFIKPALSSRERAFILAAFPVIFILGISGMVFSYLFVFPRGLEFFLSFAQGEINSLISMESYLSFLLMLVVPFFVIFNIPVIITMLGHFRVISVETFNKYQKHVILAAFILSAVITPTPDIITQALLAVPIIILYEISVAFVKFFSKGVLSNEQT